MKIITLKIGLLISLFAFSFSIQSEAQANLENDILVKLPKACVENHSASLNLSQVHSPVTSSKNIVIIYDISTSLYISCVDDYDFRKLPKRLQEDKLYYTKGNCLADSSKGVPRRTMASISRSITINLVLEELIERLKKGEEDIKINFLVTGFDESQLKNMTRKSIFNICNDYQDLKDNDLTTPFTICNGVRGRDDNNYRDEITIYRVGDREDVFSIIGSGTTLHPLQKWDKYKKEKYIHAGKLSRDRASHGIFGENGEEIFKIYNFLKSHAIEMAESLYINRTDRVKNAKLFLWHSLMAGLESIKESFHGEYGFERESTIHLLSNGYPNYAPETDHFQLCMIKENDECKVTKNYNLLSKIKELQGSINLKLYAELYSFWLPQGEGNEIIEDFFWDNFTINYYLGNKVKQFSGNTDDIKNIIEQLNYCPLTIQTADNETFHVSYKVPKVLPKNIEEYLFDRTVKNLDGSQIQLINDAYTFNKKNKMFIRDEKIEYIKLLDIYKILRSKGLIPHQNISVEVTGRKWSGISRAVKLQDTSKTNTVFDPLLGNVTCAESEDDYFVLDCEIDQTTSNSSEDDPIAMYEVNVAQNIYRTTSNTHTKYTIKTNKKHFFSSQWLGGGENNKSFANLGGLAVDSLDNVYICDSGNNRIMVYNSLGQYVTEWGSEGGDEGEFRSPTGVAIDSHNRVYVCDWGNNRVQVFDLYGKYLATWGEKGTDEGQFRWPLGIAIDSNDKVYISDTENNRIQIFNNLETKKAQFELLGKERILLIDDELTLAKQNKKLLTNFGYSVSIETDSVKAFKDIIGGDTKYDLLIIDQSMPGMMGDAIAQIITATKPNMPMILLTANPQFFNDEKKAQLGVDNILIKPVDPYILRKAIKNIFVAKDGAS